MNGNGKLDLYEYQLSQAEWAAAEDRARTLKLCAKVEQENLCLRSLLMRLMPYAPPNLREELAIQFPSKAA